MSSKSPDSKKGIQWGRVVSSGEKAPSQEKLTNLRVKGHKIPEKKRRSRQSRDFKGEKASKGVFMITFGLGALFLTAFIATGWFFVKREQAPSETAQPNSQVDYKDFLAHQDLEVEEGDLASLRAVDVARQFVMSKDVQERLKWVRSPEIIRERLSAYSEEAVTSTAVQMKLLGFRPNSDLDVTVFGVALEAGNRRFLPVVNTEDGPRVDWDAYARYCSETWEDIFEAKVKTAQVRVNVKSADSFVQNYQDREQWECFELHSGDFEKPLYGYSERASEDCAELLTAVDVGQEQVFLEIEINAEDIASGQVRISSVIKNRWVTNNVAPNK
ncbi:MAG: hypothetical protein QNK83_14840 [Akkermansiaceae bacterium]